MTGWATRPRPGPPETRDIPIVLLTERASEPDVLSGLGLGVDEYMAKPFSPRELSARVQHVLARAGRLSRPGPAGR